MRRRSNLSCRALPNGLHIRSCPPRPTVPVFRPAGRGPQVVEYIKTYNPMGRMATVKDVADAVEYLAGDLASYVSGQHLLVSGGAPA